MPPFRSEQGSLQNTAPTSRGQVRDSWRSLDPDDKGRTTLRYPYEVRNAKDYFADIPELTPAA
jgi:hypothetical protein